MCLPKEQSSCRDDKDRDYDQEVGEREVVVVSDMRVGIGGRGVVRLISSTVVVPIEQDRVLKCITLGGGGGGSVCVGVCVCVCVYVCVLAYFV